MYELILFRYISSVHYENSLHWMYLYVKQQVHQRYMVHLQHLDSLFRAQVVPQR